MSHRCLLLITSLFFIGCSSGPENKYDANAAANAKLAAVEKLAVELAKNVQSDDVFVALEEFRNNNINPKDFPEQSKKIVEIYESKIKGRFNGDFAFQAQSELELFKTTFTK